MSLHRRRSSRSSRGTGRRKLVWASRSITANTVAANNSTTNIDLLADYKTVAGASTAGITIMRTHLDLWVGSTVTANDAFAIGMKIDDLDQVVASSASALAVNPIGNVDTDWMLLRHFAATPNYNMFGPTQQVIIDLKAKRRMEEVQEAYLFCIVPLGVAAGGLPFTFSFFSRTLLALP